MKLMNWSLALIVICSTLFSVQLVNAANPTQKITKETLVIDTDSFYDKTFDYSKFSGRVTDRDATASIVKVSSETKNVRFFGLILAAILVVEKNDNSFKKLNDKRVQS